MYIIIFYAHTSKPYKSVLDTYVSANFVKNYSKC